FTVATVKSVPSPPVLTFTFRAGKYVGPISNFGIVISGPGITPGGVTQWDIALASNANTCTYPQTGTWYVGPIASSPIYSRLKAAGIPSNPAYKNWFYGIIGEGQRFCSYAFKANGIFGVNQSGNTLRFASFSVNGTDYNTPQDFINYCAAGQSC